MKPIINICSDLRCSYSEFHLFSKVKDSFKIKVLEKNYIDEIETLITKIKIPPNLNYEAYTLNMKRAMKCLKKLDTEMAPDVFRMLDYQYFNKFQRELFGYSVVNSIQVILRISNKTIKNCCIVIYDAADNINIEIIKCLAKESRYIVLLSDNTIKAQRIGEYVIANYGVSPVVTNDLYYALKIADFIITTKPLLDTFNKPVWYVNNKSCRDKTEGICIDNVVYKTPWNTKNKNMHPEVLGALLCQMEEKDVFKSLKYNDIILDKITFRGIEVEV